MTTPTEQFAAFNKANVEAALELASKVLEGAERLAQLQMAAARETLNDNTKQAKALLAAKDAQEYFSLLSVQVEPGIKRALTYSRGVYELATETQSEIAKLVEAQVGEYNENLMATLDKVGKSAPAGSDAAVAVIKSAMAAANTAYDNISKAAKQVAELTEANMAAATEVVGTASKKKSPK